MFHKARKVFKRHQQIVFAVLVLIFAVPLVMFFTTTDTGGGGRGPQAVVRIHGQKVDPGEITAAQTSIRLDAELQTGFSMQQAYSPTDEEIIQRVAFLKEAERLHIGATPQQIENFLDSYRPYALIKLVLYQKLKQSIPLASEAEIAQRLQGQMEGLLNGRRLRFEDIDRFGSEAVKLRELQRLVTSCAKVTPLAVQQAYAADNEKMAVEIVEIPAKSFTSTVTVTDEDIKTFYDKATEPFKSKLPAAGSEEYKTALRMGFLIPPRAKVLYVKFAAEDFKAGIAAPKEEEIVRYYNDHLDQFRDEKGELQKLEAVRDKVRDNYITGAAVNLAIEKAGLLTEKLYNIDSKAVRIDETDERAFHSQNTAEFTDTQGQPIPYEKLKTDERYAPVYDSLRTRAFIAKALSFYAAEIKRGVEVTKLFSVTDPVLNLQPGSEFQKKAFTLDEKNQPFVIAREETACYVLGYSAMKLPEVPPLEQVKEKARERVVAQKAFAAAVAAAGDKVREIGEKLGKGQSFTQICDALKLKVETPKPFSIASALAGGAKEIPNLSLIVQRLFQMNAGELSEAVPTPDGAVFFYLRERQAVDTQAFEKEKSTFESDLWQRGWETVLNNWYRAKVAPEIQMPTASSRKR